MTIVCSSCQRYLGTCPPYHDKGVSHRVCTPCVARERRELRTLVLSRERADTLPVLSSLFKGQPEIRLVLDRRQVERRQAAVDVELCRRASPEDRRRAQGLRLI